MRRRILRTPMAAAYVGLADRTLEKKRLARDGPKFIRLGEKAIGYDVQALDAWLDLQMARRTSEADELHPVVQQNLGEPADYNLDKSRAENHDPGSHRAAS